MVISAEPSKATPFILRDVASLVAVPAFPVIVVWSPVLDPDRVVIPSFDFMVAAVSSPVFEPVMASSFPLSDALRNPAAVVVEVECAAPPDPTCDDGVLAAIAASRAAVSAMA
jgi:hypothetical protein